MGSRIIFNIAFGPRQVRMTSATVYLRFSKSSSHDPYKRRQSDLDSLGKALVSGRSPLLR